MNNAIKDSRVLCTRRKLAVIGTLCLALAITAGALFQGPLVAETHDRAIANVVETGKAFAAVTKKVSPAVVFIKATKQSVRTGNMRGFEGFQGQVPDELLKRFFGDSLPPMNTPQQPLPMTGQGSGFIISHDGYILTNNHVVGSADKLEVTLHDGRVADAHLIGADKHTDVAIIKIDGDDLPTLPLGDSDEIDVGQWVLAVGSPFGLTGTVTSGIVSAKGRDSMGITDYEDFIQTDAAINPGNSGGPLINMRGEAIGINTAIASRSGGYNGIGFAIPMNLARGICEQLMENGSVTRGYLGVIIQPLTAELAKSFKLEKAAGVLIGDVSPDSPAAQAGLQRGDVVVQLDGSAVEGITSFRNRVALIQPGTKVKLEVMRGGQRQTISVRLGKLDSPSVASNAATDSIAELGLSVQTLSEQLAEKLGVGSASGVVVTQVVPGSAAAQQGLRPGTVITEVDHEPVKNAQHFAQLVKQHQDTDSVLMLVQQGEHTRYVVLNLKK